MNEYLKETVVYVKLGAFNLTILGEVVNPGQYQVYQSDINIFQAIALAGNATDFANKSKIKIVHQTPKGSQIVRVNLNDADLLSSPDYYLKPNDIIYVEPNKEKSRQSTTDDKTLRMTSIFVSGGSLLVSIAALIVNLL